MSERPMRRVLPCLAMLALLAPGGAGQGAAAAPVGRHDALRDGSHDFDFEFGSWKAHIRRLKHPLAGSTEWVDYEGISVVRPVWQGRANLGELQVTGPAGAITGLSLRLYDPASRQWRISWANQSNGLLTTPPMVGSFSNGRGLFYDQEQFGGRTILARFLFSNITAASFRIEQAFSADGGRTWETNWISDFTR